MDMRGAGVIGALLILVVLLVGVDERCVAVLVLVVLSSM